MHRLLLAATLAILPATAWAQDGAPPPAPPAAAGAPQGPGILGGDNVTVGLGVGYRSSYEGSDDYIVSPAPLLRGRVGGVDFEARGPGLSFDLIADAPRARVKWLAGPQFRVNLNRTSQIKDPVVRLLGERDAAIEGGGFAGVSLSGVANRFDSVSARVDVLTDLGDVHGGTLISPSLGYATPLSPAIFVVASLSATHADGNYTRSEFGVTAAGAAASGLPAFTPSGGWKDAGVNVILAYDLSGDVRDGGWSLFGLTSYSRLLEDAARSPIVRLRGDRDQWFLAAGLAYTFGL